MAIPKIAHYTWVSKDILHSQNPMILNGIRNFVDMNPDWRINIYQDHEVDQYLKSNLSDHDYQLIAERPFVERSDLWRLFKMRNEGGIYLDLDRFYNIPMNQILDDSVTCYLPTIGDFDFSHDIMISAPANELFQVVIDLNLQRRAAGSKNIFYLGPQTYMNGITLWLTGHMIDPDPGSVIFDQLRAQITDLSGFRTYKEDNPDYTLVYRYDSEIYKSGDGRTKKDFFRDHGVQHWLD